MTTRYLAAGLPGSDATKRHPGTYRRAGNVAADGSYRPIRADTYPPDLPLPEDVTPAQIRAHPWYAMWHAAVLGRDRYECQHCGARGVPLQAHHIWPVALYAEFAYKINNGETLCVRCHRLTHAVRAVCGTWQRRWDDPDYRPEVSSPATLEAVGRVLARYRVEASWPG